MKICGTSSSTFIHNQNENYTIWGMEKICKCIKLFHVKLICSCGIQKQRHNFWYSVHLSAQLCLLLFPKEDFLKWSLVNIFYKIGVQIFVTRCSSDVVAPSQAFLDDCDELPLKLLDDIAQWSTKGSNYDARQDHFPESEIHGRKKPSEAKIDPWAAQTHWRQCTLQQYTRQSHSL